jgi:hypothetical protein
MVASWRNPSLFHSLPLDLRRTNGAHLCNRLVSALSRRTLQFPTIRVEPVKHRSQLVFLLLILAQAAHSVEEYATRLYEVFPPAHFVSSLISKDLALGFLVANVALVIFGLWCWAVPLRSGWRAAHGLVWFWTLLELGNGIGHSSLAIARKGYFPGVVTAPLLLLFAVWLAVLQARA